MQKAILESYFNKLKEDPYYLWKGGDWDWGSFHFWDMTEEDNQLHINFSGSRRPVLGLVVVAMVMYLMASGLVWFLHQRGAGSKTAYAVIYGIIFLTSTIMILIGIGAQRSLKKNGRCWLLWNKFEDAVLLPRKMITLPVSDILALQVTQSRTGESYDFEIVAYSDGLVRRFYVLGLGRFKKDTNMIRTIACRMKKPLIICGRTWRGKQSVTMENVTEIKV